MREFLIEFLVEVFIQLSLIVRSRDSPVNSWEMFLLGQLFLQSPENLHNWKSRSSYRISKITSWRTDCTNDCDWTISRRRSQTGNFACSFVELGEFCSKISRISRITRHFCQTAWDFSQSFCPSGSRISHHCYVATHISEILSESDTSVDRCLTGSHRHVWSVGNKRSSLHNWYFFAVFDSCQSGELF